MAAHAAQHRGQDGCAMAAPRPDAVLFLVPLTDEQVLALAATLCVWRAMCRASEILASVAESPILLRISAASGLVLARLSIARDLVSTLMEQSSVGKTLFSEKALAAEVAHAEVAILCSFWAAKLVYAEGPVAIWETDCVVLVAKDLFVVQTYRVPSGAVVAFVAVPLLASAIVEESVFHAEVHDVAAVPDLVALVWAADLSTVENAASPADQVAAASVVADFAARSDAVLTVATAASEKARLVTRLASMVCLSYSGVFSRHAPCNWTCYESVHVSHSAWHTRDGKAHEIA